MKDNWIPNIWVSHGMVTHPVNEKCEVCEKMVREYEKALKDGTVAKIIANSASGRPFDSESKNRGSNP